MDFNITQEEILEEVKRMKEEERFREIASSEIKNDLLELSSKMKVLFEQEKKERDDTIKELKISLDQALEHHKEKDQEISSLKNSIKVESEKMIQKDKEIKELSSLVMTSRAMLDSLQSEIMSMKSELLLSKHKDSEDFQTEMASMKEYIMYLRSCVNNIPKSLKDKIKETYGERLQENLSINLRYYLNNIFYKLNLHICSNGFSSISYSNKISYEEYNYPEVKSIVSNYIIKQVKKYLGSSHVLTFSVINRNNERQSIILPNNGAIFIYIVFRDIISKFTEFEKYINPILLKYEKEMIFGSSFRPFENIKKEQGDLAPQISKELLMSLP